jgi:hypothetical protein
LQKALGLQSQGVKRLPVKIEKRAFTDRSLQFIGKKVLNPIVQCGTVLLLLSAFISAGFCLEFLFPLK